MKHILQYIYALVGISLLIGITITSIRVNVILIDIHNTTKNLTIEDYRKGIDIISTQQQIQLNESNQELHKQELNTTSHQPVTTNKSDAYVPHAVSSDECATNRMIEDWKRQYSNRLRELYPECYK